MPVCSDDKVGPEVNLSFPPDTIVERCPDSVIGNGKAYLYLARANGASGPSLKDAVLVAFNGGRNAAGLPKLFKADRGAAQPPDCHDFGGGGAGGAY